MQKQEIGRKGEELAINYLRNKDYKIIFKNYSKPRWGEIDIIAIDPNNTLSFIEVRSKTSLEYGYPEESVNYNKRKALTHSIKYYLSTSGRKYYNHPKKAELISVIMQKGKVNINSLPLDINI